MIHLGLGAFHRAHQAHYFDRLLAAGDRDWGIASVNLRRDGIVKHLNAQDNVYCRWERGLAMDHVRVIGALTGSYHLPSQREVVLALFANPDVRLVTVTVTEKGYHFDRQTGGLDLVHPDIVRDLADPAMASSLPGVLAQGLEARRRAGAGPLSLISCDNYRSNGSVLGAVVTDFAGAAWPGLQAWLKQNARFLSSMVDGIVPAVRDVDRAQLAARIGIDDPAMVVAEDYMRWVIEDDFIADRPALDTVGAEFVGDVEPFEAMKLLLVNAPHSALAYLGHNAGFEYIHEAIGEPRLERFVDRLLTDELLPVTSGAHADSARDYGGLTAGRFANPNVAYRTRKVATDGSLKIPERILPALSWHLARGQVPDGLALVLAGWVRFLTGIDETGSRYDIPDPLADELASADIHALLSLRAIFPADIGENDGLRARIVFHARGLQEHGTLGWLERVETLQRGQGA